MLILLLILQRFGRRQWGYIPELTTETHSVSLHRINDDGTLGKDEVGVDFYPEDKVHSSWTLLGRATTVVGAEMPGEVNSAVTKEEHTEAHGEVGGKDKDDPDDAGNNDVGEELNEKWRAYRQARSSYREACDKIINAHNLVLKISWPETSRPEEWKIIGHAQALGTNDKFIRGHIPEVKCARDLDRYSTRHIRGFLGLQPDGCTGTRTLRLIVMSRLRPIYDLDGEQFWNAFWQCVACAHFLFCPRTPLTASPSGHYRLWVNGIHHGDISFNNLMYDITRTGDPVGIINDFDLATWVDHSTTNNDRTGTIPFMAIDLLDGGLEDRIPRLYRHDMESFVWVLAYITVANIEYKGGSVKISPLPDVDAWFKDDDLADRRAHVFSKLVFHLIYGRRQRVSSGYHRYRAIVRQMIQHWNSFQQSLQDIKYPDSIQEENVLSEPEVDDPASSLRQFVTAVETSLGEQDVEGFTGVKTLLLEAIETPTVLVNTVL